MAKKIAKEYYLMHKDIPVCLMELTEGELSEITEKMKQLLPTFL